jgi:hypothetical protein
MTRKTMRIRMTQMRKRADVPILYSKKVKGIGVDAPFVNLILGVSSTVTDDVSAGE